ncbi:MAG: hypothetical protein JKY42_00185 [Flavobacteriales bacterium]|nr:hypothetical protein [Flavobacteriales bacterium]
MSADKNNNNTDYRKRLDSKVVAPTHQNDNIKNKCYTLTTDGSASSIGFNTPQESNNCPYMLRKRFKFIGGTIVLKFSEETLFIHGRNLQKLYEYICRHRVADIFIGDHEQDEEPYVENITLKLNSEVDIDEPPTEPAN